MLCNKSISLDELEQLEAEEYQTFLNLKDLYNQYRAENNKKQIKEIDRLIRYQRGKWSMLVDLIEYIKFNAPSKKERNNNE